MPESLGTVGGPAPVGGAIGITWGVGWVRVGRCGWGRNLGIAEGGVIGFTCREVFGERVIKPELGGGASIRLQCGRRKRLQFGAWPNDKGIIGG